MSIDLFALDEIAQLREHFILLNGSPEAISELLDPAITPASFATWIATAGKLALFQQLISAPSSIAAVAANTTSMAAVAASSVAMDAVIASSVALNTVVASSTAMAAVAASSTAMAAVAASSTAKMAVFNSDTALAAIAASATALTTLRASAGYQLSAATTNGAIAGLAAAGSYIVVGLSTSNGTSGIVTLATKRTGSTVSAAVTVDKPVATDGKTYSVAIPLVSPFSLSNSSSNWSWFIGTVRCDA